MILFEFISDLFVSKVILTCPDISINRDKLLELQFDDKKITSVLFVTYSFSIFHLFYFNESKHVTYSVD